MNSMAAISGLPEMSEQEENVIVQAILKQKGQFFGKAKKAHTNGNIRLPVKKYSLAGKIDGTRVFLNFKDSPCTRTADKDMMSKLASP